MEPALSPDSLTRGVTLRHGPCDAAREGARAGLYVHVPFCATRCTYCDFDTDTVTRARLERYLDGVEAEIRRRAPSAAGLVFSSVFFGGGTPSSLSSRHFLRLCSALRSHFTVAPDAEITLEANPESVRDTLLDTWAAAGVNRLSMGVQSFEPSELRLLGRIHDAGGPVASVKRARAHGFERLSLDLMFGFPEHDAAAWERTLEMALSLDPGHLSAYCFIPERNTPLGNAVLSERTPLPAPEAQADLYAQLGNALSAAGYVPYETSNFCRPGLEARHNLVYWLRRPYVGLGPSAHGALHGMRLGNARGLDHWAARVASADAIESEREPDDERRAMDEIVMLGLRLCSGLRARDYPAAVWASVERRFVRAFRHALATGRLEHENGRWRIPAAHRFVADDVIAWVIARADELHLTAVRTAP